MHTLGFLAQLVSGDLVGDAEQTVRGAASVHEAGPDHITFASDERTLETARRSRAGAVIVSKQAPDIGRPLIRVDNPRLAFAVVLEQFAPLVEAPERHRRRPHVSPRTPSSAKEPRSGPIRLSAPARGWVATSASFQASTSAGTWWWATIPSCIRASWCWIGSPSAGASCSTRAWSSAATASATSRTEAGTARCPKSAPWSSRTTWRSASTPRWPGPPSARRGSDAGASWTATSTWPTTPNWAKTSLSPACRPSAGSAVVEDDVTLAGQTAVAGHLRVGRGTVVAARGLVAGDVPPGSFVSGFPARPHAENMRILAAQRRAPELIKTVARLEKRLAELEARLADDEADGL